LDRDAIAEGSSRRRARRSLAAHIAISGLTPSDRHPRIVGPFSGTPVGLTVFAVSSFLKDAVNRIGDLADDGKPNDSFKT